MQLVRSQCAAVCSQNVARLLHCAASLRSCRQDMLLPCCHYAAIMLQYAARLLSCRHPVLLHLCQYAAGMQQVNCSVLPDCCSLLPCGHPMLPVCSKCTAVCCQSAVMQPCHVLLPCCHSRELMLCDQLQQAGRRQQLCIGRPGVVQDGL